MRRKIYIGTPSYGGLYRQEYSDGMIELVRGACKGEYDLVRPPHVGDSLVTRARNGVLHTFFQTDCTHLMWIDDDIGFAAEDVLSLVNSPYPFTCGAYPKKDPSKISDPAEMEYVISTPPNQKIDENGWRTVGMCGTGFMCWTREVAETLLERSKLYPYKHGNKEDKFEYRVFHNDVGPGCVYLSEDYWVVLEYVRSGGEIWCNPFIKLSHTGTATWRGDYSKQVKPPEPAPIPWEPYTP